VQLDLPTIDVEALLFERVRMSLEVTDPNSCSFSPERRWKTPTAFELLGKRLGLVLLLGGPADGRPTSSAR